MALTGRVPQAGTAGGERDRVQGQLADAAAELLQTNPAGTGYLLKDRVSDLKDRVSDLKDRVSDVTDFAGS